MIWAFTLVISLWLNLSLQSLAEFPNIAKYGSKMMMVNGESIMSYRGNQTVSTERILTYSRVFWRVNSTLTLFVKGHNKHQANLSRIYWIKSWILMENSNFEIQCANVKNEIWSSCYILEMDKYLNRSRWSRWRFLIFTLVLKI